MSAECEFVIFADVPGWLYCHGCQRYQRGQSLDLRRACRPELETFKEPPTGSAHEVAQRPPGGPGTELRRLVKECGLKELSGCGCASKARQMDRWGIGGCREHRAEIIGWLEQSAATASWGDALKVAAHGYLSVGALVDEAIRRATMRSTAMSS